MPTAILSCGSGWQSSDGPSKDTKSPISNAAEIPTKYSPCHLADAGATEGYKEKILIPSPYVSGLGTLDY